MRHVSFNSHSLITANVPYEKVVRNSDMDNFACHRRSVRVWAHPEKWLSVVASVPHHTPFPVTYSLRAGYTMTAVNQKHALSVCLEHSAAAPASGAEQDRNQLDREAMPLLKHCLLGLPAHLSRGVCVSDSVGSAYILSQRRASLDCMPVPQQPC